MGYQQYIGVLRKLIYVCSRLLVKLYMTEVIKSIKSPGLLVPLLFAFFFSTNHISILLI